MASDAELIARVRPILRRRRGYSEKKMLGGVCFLINGNMCVGSWKGSLVVRLDKADHDAIQSEAHTKPFDVTGRVMKGWTLVAPEGIRSHPELKAWVRRAAKFAESLPTK